MWSFKMLHLLEFDVLVAPLISLTLVDVHSLLILGLDVLAMLVGVLRLETDI